MIIVSFWCKYCEKYVYVLQRPTLKRCLSCGCTALDIHFHTDGGNRDDAKDAKRLGIPLTPAPMATYRLEAPP